MNFKRIVAARTGNGTVFELEDGMFAFVNHEVSTTEAKYHTMADYFLHHGYFEAPDNLPEGNCDKDIEVLRSLEKPDEYYGFGKERYEFMLKQREMIRCRMEELGGISN